MLLNRVEFALMNNPVRALVQRRIEAPMLVRMGGAMNGGRALEIGCGRGTGVAILLDLFGADSVDAFDLDPRMVARARGRLSRYGSRARVWVGDVCAIGVADETYEAVFDFGIIHHVPDWRRALAEVHRVLKPGGRLYGEEMLRRFITHPIVRRLLRHPQADRFDARTFTRALRVAGLQPDASAELCDCIAWFTARKDAR